MIPAHSTVPRWQVEPPAVDGTGRAYVVLAFGPAARPVAAVWCDELAQRSMPVVLIVSSGDVSEAFDQLGQTLKASATGLRLMVAGPEREVLAVQSAARAGGMIDAELALHVTSRATRKVYCVHCTATSSVEAAVGDVAFCQSCGRGLLIFAHLSRRSGSYLGFLADAEERE